MGLLILGVGFLQENPSPIGVGGIRIETIVVCCYHVLKAGDPNRSKLPIISGRGGRVGTTGYFVVNGFDGPIVIHVRIQRRAGVLVGGIVHDTILDQGRKSELTADPEQVHGGTWYTVPTEGQVGNVVGAVVQGMKVGRPAVQNRIISSNRWGCQVQTGPCLTVGDRYGRLHGGFLLDREGILASIVGIAHVVAAHRIE